MKYTTKSGLELPPEVVEVIEQEQARQKSQGIILKDRCSYTFGIDWTKVNMTFDDVFDKIYHNDNFTEFYKLYPKKEVQKDLDSYGNEIHKGEMVLVADYESMIDSDREPQEFICIAEKSKERYIAYTDGYTMAASYKFCRKINSNEVKKSELQSQMNDLLKQAKEIEAKINEL